jgi:DNA-directed RNA polymerase specialized sigma24 family protein
MPQRRESPLLEDVRELLEGSVVAEADDSVWKKFEGVLSTLPEPNRTILEAHFKGESVRQIGSNLGIKEADVTELLRLAKGQLIQGLRSSFEVRH